MERSQIMVDLRSNPFYLDDKGVQWVERTVASMSEHEKICQLFADPLMGKKREELIDFLQNYPIGGIPFRAALFGNEEAQDIMAELQEQSKIPYLYAGNCESGPNGVLKGGTLVASGAQVRATRDAQYAYQVGVITGKETSAVGYNWSFGPVGDIVLNWRNSLINTRAYGDDAEFVSQCVEAYNRGCMEWGVAPCLKHFPGDGWEERDQHLAIGNNGLSCEQWDETFGKIYSNAIKNGVLSIMVAHFTLPAYQRKLNPTLKDEDMQPACLSPELVNGLLRNQLKFNGLVVTDQTKMMGFYGMSRLDAVPWTIACGCDMVLGINDMEEDYEAMRRGIESGIVTQERIQDALYRILGCKAAIGLYLKKETNDFHKGKEALTIIGCEDHKSVAREAAQRAITLVKNTKNQLPLAPEKYKKVGVFALCGNVGKQSSIYGQGVQSGGSAQTTDNILESLRRHGYDPCLMTSSMEKGKIEKWKETYDAILIFADISGFAQTNSVRLMWPDPMSNCYPWYIHDIPTVFVSLNYTNHLIDVSRVPAYINAYNNQPDTIDETIRRIAGKSEFVGRYDEDVWCGTWDARF